mmetsp:Transcript_6679/g.40867  ORF Transcript_6679/g.40867 Transcript_6679/m.40867 type:complete len:86 (+) Transcript_6679:2146-2403(+)
MDGAQISHVYRKEFCARTVYYKTKANHLQFYSNASLHFQGIEFSMHTAKEMHGRRCHHHISSSKSSLHFLVTILRCKASSLGKCH